MKRRVFTGELWLSVQGWPYEVGSRGHIRRKRSHKLINPWWDIDGYGTVQLKVGRKCSEFHVDSLVASAFSGQRVNGVRPLHLNGLPWDNMPINLAWGIGSLPYENMTNLVINWSVWNNGHYQHGPYTDHRAARAAASRIGDIIIGRNPKREIVAVELNWSGNKTMSPHNPFDLVRKYQALAAQHSNQFWSLELAEAAQVILALAGAEVAKVPSPNRLPEAAVQPLEPPAAGNGAGIVRRRVARPESREAVYTPAPTLPRRPLPNSGGASD